MYWRLEADGASELSLVNEGLSEDNWAASQQEAWGESSWFLPEGNGQEWAPEWNAGRIRCVEMGGPNLSSISDRSNVFLWSKMLQKP